MHPIFFVMTLFILYPKKAKMTGHWMNAIKGGGR